MQMMVKSKVCEGALICEFLILQKVFVLISLELYIEICLYTKTCTDMRTDSLMTKKSSEFRNIFCVFELLMLKIGEMPHLNAFRGKVLVSVEIHCMNTARPACSHASQNLISFLHPGP